MAARKAPRNKAHYAKLAGTFPTRLDAAFRKIKNPYGAFTFEHGALHLNAILKKLAPTPAERVGTFVTAMLAPDAPYGGEGQLADTLTAMEVPLDSADIAFLLAQKSLGESPYALTKLAPVLHEYAERYPEDAAFRGHLVAHVKRIAKANDAYGTAQLLRVLAAVGMGDALGLRGVLSRRPLDFAILREHRKRAEPFLRRYLESDYQKKQSALADRVAALPEAASIDLVVNFEENLLGRRCYWWLAIRSGKPVFTSADVVFLCDVSAYSGSRHKTLQYAKDHLARHPDDEAVRRACAFVYSTLDARAKKERDNAGFEKLGKSSKRAGSTAKALPATPVGEGTIPQKRILTALGAWDGTLRTVKSAAEVSDGDAQILFITKEAAKRAWSKTKKLAAPLEFGWRHDDPQMGRGELQVALASQKLRGSIETLADEGSGVIDPKTAEKPNDLMRILEAFKTLDKSGYYTSPCSSSTTSGGWENANDNVDASDGVVFWNAQSHDSSFDAEGDLDRPLHLHWRGDKKLIAAALQGAGFKITIPKNEDTTFIVKPSRPRRA